MFSPLNRRRWRNFKANRRGYWSLRIFLALFAVTLFAEVIANDKPILAYYKGEVLFPVLVDYPESKFGGFLAMTDYKEEVILDEIERARLGHLAAHRLLLQVDQQGLSAYKEYRRPVSGFPWTATVVHQRNSLRSVAPPSSRAIMRSATATGWGPTIRVAMCWPG